MNRSELIAIRDFVESDTNFIFSTFILGLYHGSKFFNKMNKSVFAQNYHLVIEAMLKSNNITIKVACLKEDPDVLLGYSVMNKNGTTLHWVFVKSAWRNIGIGNLLVSKDLKVITHLTELGQGIIKKKQMDLEFNPFALS